ncbi:hypothetical protein [Infirmifilum uzonense]|uniref:hypothetical protein n=1 Tax=Infirmifilum uzonense TaxID=1550241 RepID=UPI003C78C896
MSPVSAQQKIPVSVIQTARYFLKAGEVVTRVAVLFSIVFAIYQALRLAHSVLRGSPIWQDAAEILPMVTLNLISAGTISIVLDKWYRESRFKSLGLLDLLVGAITLISAPLAGVLFIAGGLLFYVAAEAIAIFRIEEKLG